MKLLPTDSHHSFRGDTLRAAIKKDISDGLIPFYVIQDMFFILCLNRDTKFS